jgi:hypothetical protein
MRKAFNQSEPFLKLSDVVRKPPDILSDLSEIEVYCLSDPSVLVSDTVTVCPQNAQIDDSSYRLISYLDKNNEIYHYSSKEHPKICQIAKFGWEIL